MNNRGLELDENEKCLEFLVTFSVSAQEYYAKRFTLCLIKNSNSRIVGKSDSRHGVKKYFLLYDGKYMYFIIIKRRYHVNYYNNQ